jgi:lipase maturation factor 1
MDVTPWKAILPPGLLQLFVRADEQNLTLHSVYRMMSKFSLANTYQLFAVMTTSRKEVLIYGSNDKKEWKSFDFWHKPGENLSRAPTFVPLGHLPRLDWRLWFCQFGKPQEWVQLLCMRILTGSKSVYSLFRVTPWEPEAPPKYLKVLLYDYRWTSLSELKQTGMYWKRNLIGEYVEGVMNIEGGKMGVLK